MISILNTIALLCQLHVGSGSASGEYMINNVAKVQLSCQQQLTSCVLYEIKYQKQVDDNNLGLDLAKCLIERK